ncbi:YveK family protein [Anaerovoracaceae bacterium SGI.195]
MKRSVNANLLIKVIVRKVWVVLLCAILLGGAGYLKSIFESKTINANATSSIYIGHSSKSEYTQNLDMGIQDCIEIAKSRNVLETAIKKLDLNMSIDELSGKYKVENITNSRIIRLSVNDNNRKNAIKIASTIQDIAIEKINEIDKSTNAVVIEEARLSESQKIKQNNYLKKGVVVGAFFGLVILMFVYRKQYIFSEE